MPPIEAPIAEPQLKTTKGATICYHCGTRCVADNIVADDKNFCCEGCLLVYEILNEKGLCDYYKIQEHPGLTKIPALRKDKFAYLDNADIAGRLYKFTDGDHSIVTFYLPGVHCSSCMWLLEHLGRVNTGVTESRLNFTTKEVTIHFHRSKITLRQLVELLATIGYEPYISLEDGEQKKAKAYNLQRIYKLGVAGFCFGNIMMMSFPEYLSLSNGIEKQYADLFRYMNLALSVPVFFYSASEFFVTAWKGLRQKMLNIDAPIALAILITFVRSVYEILANKGAGYLDSMSGIVFFMLVGRLIQERTYKSISFHRDYKSYFPIAVNVVTPNGVESRSLQDLKEKDVVQLHNDEIVPADSILVAGTAAIDYSFVTGESEPVKVTAGSPVYAGGKQTGGEITLQVVKPVAGSYLTSLWNHYAFTKDKGETNDQTSAVHLLSKYFTIILFSLTGLTAAYWAFHDPSGIVRSVSAMLIVACPCALLLCVTFTNGNMLRVLSNNGLFLRDATVIEQLRNVTDIVFDKTGTITRGGSGVATSGHDLTEDEKDLLYNIVKPSRHPNSKTVTAWLGIRRTVPVTDWKEIAGQGLSAHTDTCMVKVGSAAFAGADHAQDDPANVYVNMNGKITALHLHSKFRDSVPQLIPRLAQRYRLALLSGDNDRQRRVMQELFGSASELQFGQQPVDKLRYVENLQMGGRKVMMIGDGLNDAGALQQSNVGITLADDINNFTPSCDAILDAARFGNLPAVLRLAKVSGRIINLCFAVSIMYNLVGLYYASQGLLRPMYAAILMPCSTLSIVLISTGVTGLVAKKLGLSLKVAG